MRRLLKACREQPCLAPATWCCNNWQMESDKFSTSIRCFYSYITGFILDENIYIYIRKFFVDQASAAPVTSLKQYLHRSSTGALVVFLSRRDALLLWRSPGRREIIEATAAMSRTYQYINFIFGSKPDKKKEKKIQTVAQSMSSYSLNRNSENITIMEYRYPLRWN